MPSATAATPVTSTRVPLDLMDPPLADAPRELACASAMPPEQVSFRFDAGSRAKVCACGFTAPQASRDSPQGRKSGAPWHHVWRQVHGIWLVAHERTLRGLRLCR